MSRAWGPDLIFKVAAYLVLFVAVFIVLLGGGLNNNQVKYSRFHTEECAHGLFIIDIKDSQFCCDEHYHETDWPCMAAFDFINEKFSSMLAWVIPLFPWVCTAITDTYHEWALANTSPGPGTGMTSIRPGLRGVHVRRLALYIALFLFRTVRCRSLLII
jgi:hypothetical protein